MTNSLDSLPTVPAPEFQNWDRRKSAPTVEAVKEQVPPTTKPVVPANQTNGLEEIDLKFLKAVKDNPGKPSSIYPKLLKIGARKAQIIRKKLVGLGYLKEHVVNANARGRSTIVLEAFFICP